MSLNAKAKAQTGHALRRAYERYGLRLTENDLHEIVKAIQQGRATHIVSQSLRISVFDLLVDDEEWGTSAGVKVRVVYDKERKTIVTFLHEGQGYV